MNVEYDSLRQLMTLVKMKTNFIDKQNIIMIYNPFIYCEFSLFSHRITMDR